MKTTTAPQEPIITLHEVTKVYHSGEGRIVALDAVNLVVSPGEFVAVVGKSGSGKSTLINILTGIDRPTQGKVQVGGAPLHTLSENALARWRGLHVGIVFQFFQLLPALTAVENVMLPMDFAGRTPRRERRSRALHLLERVGLADHAHKLPSELSGGQQQRVAIARALANDPPLIIADEPTGNLDSHTAAEVFALFEALVAEGKTVFVVTHDLDLAQRAHRVITLADGAIVRDEQQKTFETQKVRWVA